MPRLIIFVILMCFLGAFVLIPQPTIAQESLRLDATFTNAVPYLEDGSGSIQFDYPSEWYVSEQPHSGITVSVSENPLTQETPSISVIPLPSSSAAFAVPDTENHLVRFEPFAPFSDSVSLMDYVEPMLERLENVYGSLTRDSVTAIRIGGFDAVEVSYSTEFALVTATLFVVDDGAEEPFAVLIFCTAETYEIEHELAREIAATVNRDFEAAPAVANWEALVESIDLEAPPLLNEYETLTLTRAESQRGVMANIQAVAGDILYINISSFATESHLSQLLIVDQAGELVTSMESTSVTYFLPDDLPETVRPNAEFNIEETFEFFLTAPSTGTFTLIIAEEGDQYLDRRPTGMRYDYTVRYQIPEAISVNQLVTGFLEPNRESVYIVEVDSEATIEARRWVPFGDETNFAVDVIPLVNRQLINDTDQPNQHFMIFSFEGSSTYHGTRYNREMRTETASIDAAGRYAIVLSLEDLGATLESEQGAVSQPFAMVVTEGD